MISSRLPISRVRWLLSGAFQISSVRFSYAEEEGEVFLGRSGAQTKHMSDETAKLIDNEIRQIIDRNYARAKQILEDNMDIMHAMKDALMKYETIDAGQIDDLMDRKSDIREPAGWSDKNTKPSSSSDKKTEETVDTSSESSVETADKNDSE